MHFQRLSWKSRGQVCTRLRRGDTERMQLQRRLPKRSGAECVIPNAESPTTAYNNRRTVDTGEAFSDPNKCKQSRTNLVQLPDRSSTLIYLIVCRSGARHAACQTCGPRRCPQSMNTEPLLYTRPVPPPGMFIVTSIAASTLSDSSYKQPLLEKLQLT